jgi:hypothetical protein
MLKRMFLALLFPLATIAIAGETPRYQVVIQRAPLAGFSHHVDASQWARMRVGDPLTLSRETANPYDVQAVRVNWYDQFIGYLPRSENGAIARALDRGMHLNATISRLRDHPNPRKRVEIEVRAEIGAIP